MLTPDFQRPLFAALLVAAAMSGAWGCSSEENSATDSREERPLKPLVYTEDPDHSPEAAATRAFTMRV